MPWTIASIERKGDVGCESTFSLLRVAQVALCQMSGLYLDIHGVVGERLRVDLREGEVSVGVLDSVVDVKDRVGWSGQIW